MRHTRSSAEQQLLEARAHGLRKAPTVSESALWAELRGKKLGVSFRRQVPLAGRCVADFVAPAQRLIVEVDGGYHARRVAADARRERALRRLGYRVLRLEAELVMKDLPAAVALVREALGAG
jgi:very-short-patch-repair endonuclease